MMLAAVCKHARRKINNSSGQASHHFENEAKPAVLYNNVSLPPAPASNDDMYCKHTTTMDAESSRSLQQKGRPRTGTSWDDARNALVIHRKGSINMASTMSLNVHPRSEELLDTAKPVAVHAVPIVLLL